MGGHSRRDARRIRALRDAVAGASPGPWRMGRVDAGDGRSIGSDTPLPLEWIRVGTPLLMGSQGSRHISAAQRDRDAGLIVLLRNEIEWLLDLLEGS